MKRTSVALMLCGFGCLSFGCYERPGPLAGGTEAGTGSTDSTTMPQASTSDGLATTDATTDATTTSMTSTSTTSGSGSTTGTPDSSDETDSDTTTGPRGTETGTTDTEDASSSTGETFEFCDPLTQNCVKGEGCYPNGGVFGCQIDSSGASGAHGDECGAVNECNPGNICVTAEAVGACDAGVASCCTRICDLAFPECPGISPICTPWFTPGEEPDGLESVGICTAS